MRLGYIGLGNMGGALAARLAPGGDVYAFDMNAEAVAAQVSLGAAAAPDLRSVAKECDVIFLCLPTSAHVRQVIFGPDGLSGDLRPGTVIIDQTSGDPRETRQINDELASLGVDLVDAPVSGGPVRAAEGTIAIMVGCADEQYARVQTLLHRISPNVCRAGELGSGHAVKLVNNLVSGIIRWATLEGVALAAKLGVCPQSAVEIMSAGGARNDWMAAVTADPQRESCERVQHRLGPQGLEGRLRTGRCGIRPAPAREPDSRDLSDVRQRVGIRHQGRRDGAHDGSHGRYARRPGRLHLRLSIAK